MNTHTHPLNSLHSTSTRERRLIFDKPPSAEVLDKRMRETSTLIQNATTPDQIAELHQKFEEFRKSPQEMKKLEKHFSHMSKADREMMGSNLGRFKEIVEQHVSDQEKRVALLQTVQTLRDSVEREQEEEPHEIEEEENEETEAAEAASPTPKPPQVQAGQNSPDTGTTAPSEKKKSGWEKTVEWANDHNVNPLKWSRGTQIAVAVATIGLFTYWMFRKKKNSEGASSGPSKWWLLVPGVGLAYLAYKGMQNINWFKAMEERVEKKIAEKFKKGLKDAKDTIIGPPKGEEYGLSKDQFNEAEKEYREHLRGPNPDLKKIREIFKLKEGETSPHLEAFMKNMGEKYQTKEKNGVTYARADVALRNYEKGLEIAINEMKHWILANEKTLLVTVFLLNRAGFITLKGALQGSATVTMKAATIVKELGKIGLRHPILSFFTVGSGFLAWKAAEAGSKKMYLPENFEQLGKALGTNEISLGETDGALDRLVKTLREHAEYLMDIGLNISLWVSTKLIDFGKQALKKAPELIGSTQEKSAMVRNRESLDDLDHWLNQNKEQALLDSSSEENVKKPAVFETAREALKKYTEMFITERCIKMSSSDEPQHALQELKIALAALDVDLVEKNGMIKWKRKNGDEVDLCVDPAIKDTDQFYNLSNKILRASEWAGEYAFVRGIARLREKIGQGREIGEYLTENQIVAQIIGSSLYIFNPSNWEQFYEAPVALVKKILGYGTWTECFGNLASASADAGALTLSVTAMGRIKRMLIGGQLGAPKNFSTVVKIAKGFNPFTVPQRVLQSLVRGSIDIETFIKMGGWSERGGRYFNTVLSKANVRPEWIGIIEHSTNEEELIRVGEHMGRGNLKGLNATRIKRILQRDVLRKMREIQMRDFGNLKMLKAGNYIEIYNSAKNWYATRTAFSRAAVNVGKVVDYTVEPVNTALKAIRSLPKSSAALRASGRFAMRGARIGADAAVETYKFAATIATKAGPLWTAALNTCRAGGTEVLDILAKVKMPQAVIDAFASCKPAMEMLIRAIQKGGPTAGQYLSRLGTMALKIGGPTLGVAGIGLDVYLCATEMAENQARMAGTKNQALKDLYASRDNASLINAEVGIATGALAIATGAASAVTLACLPVVIAAGAGYWYRGKFEEVSETWLKDYHDWEKSSETDILKKLQALQPGADSSLAQRIGASRGYNKEKNFGRLEAANASARDEILRGYFRQGVIPLPGEDPKVFAERRSVLATDAMRYLQQVTNGGMDTVNIEVLLTAKRHAEVLSLSRRLKESGDHQMITLEHDGKKQEFDLADYEDLPAPAQETAQTETRRGEVLAAYRNQVQDAGKVLNIKAAIQMEDPNVIIRIIAVLLQDIQPYLAKLESKIQAQEYVLNTRSERLRYMLFLDSDSTYRSYARATAFNALRGVLDSEVAKILESEELTVQGYQAARSHLIGSIQETPMEYYRRAMLQRPGPELLNKEDILTIPGIVQTLTEESDTTEKHPA